MTGIDLGTVTVRGRVEIGMVTVDGNGSSARISGVYLGDGAKLDNADIDRYIHLDDVQVVQQRYLGGRRNFARVRYGYRPARCQQFRGG